MAITLISQINDAGKSRFPFSEDWIGVSPSRNMAWLLDGASPSSDRTLLKSEPSDARWLVRSMSRAFHQVARENEDITSVAEAALHTVRSNFELAAQQPILDIPVNDLPSAAGIMMHYDKKKGKIHFLGLGDCIATIVQSGKLVGTTTPTMNKADENARIFPEDRERTREAYHAWKRGMNRNGGYWIFSVHPEAARQARVESFSLTSGSPVHILLMSDGFERLVETFGRHTYETLTTRVAEEQDLTPALHELREIERKYWQNPALYPDVKLTKPHDDAAALLLEITP
jgi:hypothetical protein